MYFIYNLLISLYGGIVKLVSIFNPKAKLWVEGRKNVLQSISENINPDEKPIWFHAASLGEFEQGRPIIEAVKQKYPNKKVLLTFYSPSGYEVRKDYDGADWIYYLPLDTKSNSDKFVELVNPEIAVFIKYEFWPNIINSLYKAKVNTIVISAIFREDQIFFKSYGGWMRKSLLKFSKFFVQDENSVKLLNSIGIDSVEKSGDTRFDRVMDILQNNNTVEYIEEFKADKQLLVCGSTWPSDDEILIEYLNSSTSEIKTVLAPHNINAEYNKKLAKKLNKKVVLFSEMEGKNLSDYEIFILDTVGVLTKVYSYADIAYVGGGFGKEGIHNILEPAVFSTPVITGPIFHQFKEAVDLNELGAMIVVKTQGEFISEMEKLENGKNSEVGEIAFKYIEDNSGAQNLILEYISQKLNHKEH